jgi:two-component system CheB/CheR fusion protein
LQSTNEELETLNEELQSTNEELETMNEELQSTNQELETINDELRQRTAELNQVNDFLESIMASLRVGIIVVDPGMNIQAWNHKAEDLWGLREDEVAGRHLMSIDIGLPVSELRQGVKDCLSGVRDYQEVKLVALNRRGHRIECTVICTPLKHRLTGIRGAIILMEEQQIEPEQAHVKPDGAGA